MNYFGERAVKACWMSFVRGRVVERSVRDILRSENVDVTPIEGFLADADSGVRLAAARIVAAKGNVSAVVDAVCVELDFGTILTMLQCISDRGFDDTDAAKLSDLFSRQGALAGHVKEHVIDMMRRTGHKSALFPLLFDEDDAMVERAKGYMA